MLQQIKASAGSGKTFTLTRQFLTLLREAAEQSETSACAITHAGTGASNEGHCWPEIFAVTFTNKAAAEMRERIVRSLKERALDMEPGNPAAGWDKKSAARWVTILLRRYSSLNVRTIDSLLNMLVRLAALELDLPPDFEPIFDERELFDPLYDAMLDAARAGGPERELLSAICRTLLTEADRKGFVAGEGIRGRLFPLMSKQLADGTLPDMDEQVLRGWLQNTHKTYVQAAESLSRYIADEGLSANSNFLRFLGKVGDGSPFRAPDASAYTTKAHVDDCLLKASKGKGSEDLARAYAELCTLHGELATTGLLVRKALILVPFVRLAEPLARKAQTMQQSEGKVPSSLWPHYARRILTGEAGASEAFCRMGTRLMHLLIDEFQDTSLPQWHAIQPLALECLSKGGSLTYVGDVKQAIYSWRGGDSALFESILDDPELRAVAGEPQRSPLAHNWRSCEEIINFNNAAFSRLTDPDVAGAFVSAFLSGAPDHLQAETAQEIVRNFAGVAQDIPESRLGNGGHVHVYDITGKDTEDLYAQVENRFIPLFRDELLPRRNPGEIAVLVRKNEEAALVARWLVELNVPVITENSLRLADHPIIAQTVAFLRFLDYPPDDLAFWTFISGRHLMGPLTGLSGTELDDWLASPQTPRTGSLFAAFRADHPQIWQAWIAPFYTQAGLLSAYDTVRELFMRVDAFGRFPQDAIFLRRFLEVVFAAETRGKRSLSSFLEHWSASGTEEKVPMPENVDAVRIMTMHKAKGLEFPAVVIPFHHHTLLRSSDPEIVSVLGQEVLVPRCKELGETYYQSIAAEIREQLHLLYVAWTRPVEELHAFITSTPFHEGQSPTLAALRLLLEDYGMGRNREKREQEFVLGAPPAPGRSASQTSGAACAGEETSASAPSAPDAALDGWKPMHWLPRLKIFRNPLQDITFDERRRGTLVHGCLELLHQSMPQTESIPYDKAIQRAIRHGMAANPMPIPNRTALVDELQAMFAWLTALPEFPYWQRHGTPEQPIMDTHGAQHRTDLLVDDGRTLTVVEYKTGQPSAAHRQQVARYVNLLAAIPAYADRKLCSALVYLDLRELHLNDHADARSEASADDSTRSEQE